MNRNTGELTLIEKKEVPGSDKSPASLPMALAPNKRFIYAQLRGEPYPVSTFSIDYANGMLTHVGTTPLVDQLAYLNVDKSGKHLLGASYVGAKVVSYPIDAHYVVEEKSIQIIDTQPKAHCVFIDAADKGLSSIEPNDAGDEVDCGQEVARGLFVACGDCTELLDLGEEVLDQMALAIKLSVIVAQRGSVGPGRDHGVLASCSQRLEDACVGIERFVGDQHIGLHRRQQLVCPH